MNHTCIDCAVLVVCSSCLFFVPPKLILLSVTHTTLQHHPYAPCLGAADEVHLVGGDVLGAGLHARRVTAVVGFCQAKAAHQLSPGCWGEEKVLMNANTNNLICSILLSFQAPAW